MKKKTRKLNYKFLYVRKSEQFNFMRFESEKRNKLKNILKSTSNSV